MSEIKNISLYIPHVFPNFDKAYISKAFNPIGEISHIDLVPKQDRDGKNFNAVYVHFNKWYNNKSNRDLYSNITENGYEHWYHDDFWYWIMLPNTGKRYNSGDRKPRIDLGESKAISACVKVCPPAPQKRSYVEAIEKPLEEVKQSLEVCFDEVADFEAEIEAEMDEIEKFMDEQDANIIKIDGRYVQHLEQENYAMNMEITKLRAALINADPMYDLYCN
jgi:hypothetical protein